MICQQLPGENLNQCRTKIRLDVELSAAAQFLKPFKKITHRSLTGFAHPRCNRALGCRLRNCAWSFRRKTIASRKCLSAPGLYWARLVCEPGSALKQIGRASCRERV